MPIKNEMINDRYKIKKVLGEGASSNVYLAYDNLMKFNVALKIEKPYANFSATQSRFEMEGKFLKGINHPNIANVYDYFIWNKRMVIVMEILEGETLDSIISKQKYLSSEQIAKYAIEILKALVELHHRNIMHRDLKPQNIMVGFDNSIKLMDFGIMQISKDQDLTKEGAVIGTIEYMAPEIIRSEKANPQTELYSLGVILYKMATGIVPFKSGGDSIATATKILAGEYEDPSLYFFNLDPNLEFLIKKLLKTNYLDRPENAEAAIKEFETYLKQSSLTSFEFKKKKKEKKIKLNNKKVILFLIIITIILILFISLIVIVLI